MPVSRGAFEGRGKISHVSDKLMHSKLKKIYEIELQEGRAGPSVKQRKTIYTKQSLSPNATRGTPGGFYSD